MSQRSPFNLKTVLAGVLFSAGMVFLAQYSVNVVQGSFMAIDHMPAGGIFLFFLLTFLLNPLLRFFTGNRFFFTPSELLIIYSMVLVTACLSDMGLGCQFLPIIATPGYFATPANRWDTLILPHIKPWLTLRDPEAIRQFFEGAPPGAGVPWNAWAGPLAAWSVFLLTLYFVTICAVSILRKEWVERERIAFPLVELPVAMTVPGKGRLPALFTNPIFWIGFVLPLVISSLVALHKYYPLVPAPVLRHSLPVFRNTSSWIFYFSFPIIGFCYFIRQDVAFSLWFFNLLYFILKGWFNLAGVSSAENVGSYGTGGNAIFSNFGSGAFIAFVGILLFAARSHLGDVVRKALGRGPEIDDSGEIMSYRFSFWGLTGGLLLLLVWLVWAGMSWWAALFLLALAFVFWLGVTRVVAEGGLATLVAPSIASSQVVSGVGSGALGTENMVNLGLSYVYHGDLRTFPASAAMHSEKIGEHIKSPSLRPLFWLMLTAVVIGIGLSSFLVLRFAYAQGGINLHPAFFTGTNRYPFTYVAGYLTNLSGPSHAGWLCRIAGAVGYVAVAFLHARFLAWPLHPLGFAVGMVWLVDVLWFSIFIAWLIKTLFLRYGGARLYNMAKPFFFGLVLGQYSAAGIWFVIDAFTGMTGNVVFWV